MAKAAKQAVEEATNAPPKRSKKRLLIVIVIITALLLLLGAGVAAYMMLNPAQGAKRSTAVGPAKFVELGSYTANLMREDGDRYLQISISLKLSNPDLEDKIKASNPEIQHHLNMLLQSKRPSEIATFEGKQRLADQIRWEVETVLGLRKSTPDAPNAPRVNSGISEVLFTSFIIQ